MDKDHAAPECLAKQPVVWNNSEDYSDISIYVVEASGAEWKFGLSLEHETGVIQDSTLEYATDANASFDETDQTPPEAVMIAFRNMRPVAVAELDALKRKALEARAVGRSSAEPIDPTSPHYYAEVMRDKTLQLAHQDQLDSYFGNRNVDVRNALRTLGWEGQGSLTKADAKITWRCTNVGAGQNVVGVEYEIMSSLNGLVTVADDLKHDANSLAEWIDLQSGQTKFLRNDPKTVVIKTRSATPLQLNWLVAIAQGGRPELKVYTQGFGASIYRGFGHMENGSSFEPTESWAQGGPIAEAAGISSGLALYGNQDGTVSKTGWWASKEFDPLVHQDRIRATGPTELIAKMRCYCLAELGEEVDVPSELVSPHDLKNAIVVELLPELKKRAGAAYTFAQVASEMLERVNGEVADIDWLAFNEAVIQRSIVENRQPAQSVLNVLLEFSPGAITPEQQELLNRRVVEIEGLQATSQQARSTHSISPD